MKSLLAKFREASRRRRLTRMSPEDVFARIYRRNSWGDADSLSGKGSNLEATEKLRSELPDFLRNHGVASFLDIPCGDFHWMRHVDLEGIDYIGGDIVPELVDGNQKYADSNHRFEVLDLTSSQLPQVDLIFTRDCIVHLSTEHAMQAIANICASGARYLMATTFPVSGKNEDILTGQWRPIDMTKAPFSFPDPIDVINEDPPAGKLSYPDKAMGLWTTANLPQY